MKKLFLFLIIVAVVWPFNLAAAGLDSYEFFKLNGESVVGEEIMEGSEKTVFFFWTSLCYFCRRELTKINNRPIVLDGVKFYYINLGESVKIVNYMVEKLKLTDVISDDIILDDKTVFAQRFNIIGLPTYLFFKDGKVIYRTNLINEQIVERVFNDE
ncbi:MAG: thioredoxin fold domain-containing protein [Candidatus Omnitrophica bacterium]|nr:thioredoxin fold domain-containing protein [Candidatus Omnitrophota bacterium]